MRGYKFFFNYYYTSKLNLIICKQIKASRRCLFYLINYIIAVFKGLLLEYLI